MPAPASGRSTSPTWCPWPVPGPPAKVITTLGHEQRAKCRKSQQQQQQQFLAVAELPRQKVYVKHHPFRMHGRLRPRICCGSLVVPHFVVSPLAVWQAMAAGRHSGPMSNQRYCCYKFKESCVTKAGVSLKLSWFLFFDFLCCAVSPAKVSVSESRLKHGRHRASHVRGNVAVAGLAAAVAEESLQDHHARSSRDRARESRGAGAATSRNQSHRPCSRSMRLVCTCKCL